MKTVSELRGRCPKSACVPFATFRVFGVFRGQFRFIQAPETKRALTFLTLA